MEATGDGKFELALCVSRGTFSVINRMPSELWGDLTRNKILRAEKVGVVSIEADKFRSQFKTCLLLGSIDIFCVCGHFSQ